MLRFIVSAAALALPAALFAQDVPAIPRTQFISDMDTQFRKMDADKNGQLTRLEVEQFQKLTAIAEAQARNQALFAQLDGDRDGMLSAAEFSRVTAPAAEANGLPVVARMDSNGDKQVSLVEHRTATLANFDRLDADKDSVVTGAELKAGGIGQ